MKLIRILIVSNKLLLSACFCSLVVGFTFLFTISALTGTIIKTKQDNTVKNYGKFLAVIPDIGEQECQSVKEEYPEFNYESYNMSGKIDYKDKEIATGYMKEKMGEMLGFHMVKGTWPKASNQIVVEQYLLKLFGVEKKKLPINITLKKDGISTDYEITGVISDYSYRLPNRTGKDTGKQSYPSMIQYSAGSDNEKKSLVVFQKKLNFKQAKSDIEDKLSFIQTDNICLNVKLFKYAYSDVEDIIYARAVYIILINLLLILAQIVAGKTFLLKNRKTFSLFEAMGISHTKKMKLSFGFIQSFLLGGLLAGWLFAGLIGKIYIDSQFQGYSGNYIQSFYGILLMEVIIIEVLVIAICFLYDRIGDKSIIGGMTGAGSKVKRKYGFKKLDFGIIIMQIVCIVFTMGCFYSINAFSEENDEIWYDLNSNRGDEFQYLGKYEYRFTGDRRFSFEDFDKLAACDSQVRVSAQAETKGSTILLDKDNIDSYFKPYFASNDKILTSYEMTTEEQMLWNQVSKQAMKYEPLNTDDVHFTVLPKREFERYMKKNQIQSKVLEDGNQKACIVELPNYKKSGKNSCIKEMDTINIGGIWKSGKRPEFHIERFTVGALLGSHSEEDAITMIISEEVAKKSTTVLGYHNIHIEMDTDISAAIKDDVTQKIIYVMAALQGDMIDSNDMALSDYDWKLRRDYTSFLGYVTVTFCVLVIFLYVMLSIHIDWEKHHYEYGVLRSFGMSYSALQHKLFLRYSNGIFIAGVIAIYFGNVIYTSMWLTKSQIAFSILLTVGITYLGRIGMYIWKRKESVRSMLES